MAWALVDAYQNRYGNSINTYVGEPTDVLATLPTPASPTTGQPIPGLGSKAYRSDMSLAGQLAPRGEWDEVTL